MSGIIGLIILGVVFVLLSKLVRIVPQGYEWTVQRWGKYTHTLTPGFHLLVPMIQSIGHKMNMMEQVLDVPSQDVITKDNAVVRVDGVVFYQVLDAAKAAYEVANLEQAALALIMTNIRTVVGSMDLDESLSKRDEINAKLLDVIDEATHPWGVKVTRIEIKDISPPRDLVDSMARQMKAEREKRANVLEAEGLRQAAILKADGEKQAAILEAEGKRGGLSRSRGTRTPRRSRSQGHHDGFRRAIAGGDINAINYFVANKYVEALKAMANSSNQKMLLMPFEASGILGSLAGIAEIAKARSRNPARRRHRRRACRRCRRCRADDDGGQPHATNLVAGYGWWILALVLIGAGDDRARLLPAWSARRGGDGPGHAVRAGPPVHRPGDAFGVLAVITCLVYWKFIRPVAEVRDDQPLLNRRGDRMLGRRVLVAEAFVNGRGKVRVGDTVWLAEGADVDVGDAVEVVSVNGATLTVKPAD